MTKSSYEEMMIAIDVIYAIVEQLSKNDIYFGKVDSYVSHIEDILRYEVEDNNYEYIDPITEDTFISIMKHLKRLIELNEVIAPLLGIYENSFIASFVDSCTDILMNEMIDKDPEFKDEYLILDSLYIDDYYSKDENERFRYVYETLYGRNH